MVCIFRRGKVGVRWMPGGAASIPAPPAGAGSQRQALGEAAMAHEVPPAIPDPPAPHPEPERLAAALVRCNPWAIPWAGLAYRAAAPRRANVDDLLTGMGARAVGGRWNPRGAFRAIYLSCDHLRPSA